MDSTGTWDPVIPVTLPIGPVTLSSIISASMGVFVPFFVFACALFYYLYGIWHSNSDHSGISGGTANSNHPSSYPMHLHNNNKSRFSMFQAPRWRRAPQGEPNMMGQGNGFFASTPTAGRSAGRTVYSRLDNNGGGGEANSGRRVW